MKYLKYFENIRNYYYSNEKLTTLKELDIPKHVGQFSCTNNKLTSLEFGPEYVDFDFICYKNELTSLEYCPKQINGDFVCHNNKLTSLEFCPNIINGTFDFDNNNLTTLEFCPETVGGNFICSSNKLTSLEFCTKHINGNFYCGNNLLTSLEFFPESVGGKIYCGKNNWMNPIPYNIWLDTSGEVYTKEQMKKFGSYDFQKEFLTNYPEKYKDLEPIGYDKKIKEEFDWLFNAINMGLM